jgi:hypothetical protein
MLASQIVWLDCLLMNVDRTTRNTNMLWWHKELWLIDHGASLYFHHAWHDWQQPERPFPNVKDHVLLPQASMLKNVNEVFKTRLTSTHIRMIVSLIPDEWLLLDSPFETVEQHRAAYIAFLETRLAHADFFVNEAEHARTSVI